MAHAIPALPNPLTPMAFLPPQVAIQQTNSVYVLVGGCAVFIWDLLDNLSNDYKLLTRYRITIPTIVYFVSRLGSLGLAISATLYISAGITENCQRFLVIVGSFYPITIPATSLLFLFRLTAVFNGNKIVIAFFSLIWLAQFASAMTIPWGLTGANIGPTKYCLTVGFKDFIIAPTLISFISDTFVLLAISWKLVMSAYVSPQGVRGVRGMVLGDYLPSFSRALLQGGQQYYTATVTLNLVVVILGFISSVPATYRLMLVIPNIALMNIMACRVYRNTKLGNIREANSYTTSVGAQGGTGLGAGFGTNSTGAQRVPGSYSNSGHGRFQVSVSRDVEGAIDMPSRHAYPDPLLVHISKDIEYQSEDKLDFYANGTRKGVH